jgi:PAS domain-containing protein
MLELLYELMALLMLWLCLSAWQRDRAAPGRRLFMALCMGVSLWSAAHVATGRVALPPRLTDALLYLGVLSVAPLWLALALRVRGAPVAVGARAPFSIALLLAPGAICYGLLLSGDGAGWFLAREADGNTTLGPLWWAHAGYAWAIAIAGSVRFVRGALQMAETEARLRRLGTGLMSFTPILGSLAYVASGLRGEDPTPLFLGATLVALRSELYAGDLLQSIPISHHDLVSHIPTPLILTDLEDRVTEINPAAQLRLGITRSEALGRRLGAVRMDAVEAADLERWALVAAGREAGHILLVQPRRKLTPEVSA